MKKLPKLINRYTSSKDYYSYEKDYLHELKVFMNILKIKNSIEIKTTMEKLKTVAEFHEKLEVSGIVDYFDSLILSFPVFYISDHLIKIAYNTSLSNNLSIQNVFIDDAIFLFPINNELNIKFCVTRNNRDVFGRYNNNYITSRFKLNSKFKNKDISSSIPKDSLNGLANWYSTTEMPNSLDETKKGIENIIAQIFLYMSAYKNDGMKVISESNSNGIGFKQGKSRLLTPPTIGFREKAYVENQHKLASIPNPNLQGIKKQTHWRRGHWRQYDDGKLTWIRPCLINPITE